MRFLITRLSDKKNIPAEGAAHLGETLFGDPVYGIEVSSLEDLLKVAQRSKSSAPGDVGLVLWRRGPQGMSLPEDLEDYPVIEIYDDVRDSY